MRKQWNSVQRFSLRKFSTGLASVLLATMFMSQGVMAQTNEVSEKTNDTEVVNQNKENTVTNVQPKATEGVVGEKVEAPEQPVIAAGEPQSTTTLGKEKEKIEEPKVAINTTKLETLIKEVEGLDLEKYTEESVKELNVRLAKAKDSLVNAKSQKEIDSAYNALVGYKNSGLKRVPKLEENNTPKPDTTGGKETVGKKAENTEPNGTNIAGHNHSLNGTTLPEGSGFRDASTPDMSDVTMGLWSGTKYYSSNIYVTESNHYIHDNNLKVKVKSGSDAITELTVTGNDGFTPEVKTSGIGSREADLYFNGTTPNSGGWAMRVTAKTAKGGTKTFEFGVYYPFKKPTIEKPTEKPEGISEADYNKMTLEEYLKGKANSKPTLNVTVPSAPPMPANAKMKVYLVHGGIEYRHDGINAYPEGYNIIARKEVTPGNTTVTIESKDYDKNLIEGKIKALTVIELNETTPDGRPDDRGSFYSSEVTVTAPAPEVNKTGALNAITAEADKQKELIKTKQNVFTPDEIKGFNTMVTDKAEEAKTSINKTETDTAEKVEKAKDAGLLALNKVGAIVEIEATKKAKDAAIENNANITDKDAAKATTKEAADKAKEEINKDTTNTADLVGAAKAKGILGLEKAGAIAEIDAAQKAKDAAFDTNNKLTSSEKAEVKAEVARIRNQAIADVRKATDVKDVENITNIAVVAILNVRPRYNNNSNSNSNHSSTTHTNHSQSDNDMMKALLAKKEEAKMLIEQEAMKKKAEISQAELSESEKALLDARVDQEKANAFQMIDQATTIEEVNQALKAGIEVIRSIAVASANGRMTDVTPEESEAAMAQAHRQVLPQTGTGNEVAIFGAAASAILAGLGLVVPSKKKED